MSILTILLITGLIILITGTLNIACFFIGAKVGQKVSKDEPIQMPSLDPMKTIRDRESRRIAEKEQNKLDIILQNIENYDGTGLGQKDVP